MLPSEAKETANAISWTCHTSFCARLTLEVVLSRLLPCASQRTSQSLLVLKLGAFSGPLQPSITAVQHQRGNQVYESGISMTLAPYVGLRANWLSIWV